MTLPWRTAWVTGASSGIGRRLALDLARSGVRVAASARRGDELQALAREQSGISPLPLDVTDATATAAAVRTIQSVLGPIDLAILNAGVGPVMRLDTFDAELAARTMAVNYLGHVNGIAALAPAMRARGCGHVALVSSLAGYRGIASGAAYSPTKAAAISLAECLRPDFAAAGLTISIVNPGFVATPMTAQARHPLPFQITPEAASRRIIRGLARGRFEIAFPWQMALLLKLGRVLPYGLYFRMLPDPGRSRR